MIDLHLHTKLSIGENSPDELIELAKENNLEVFSITDNDHCLAYQGLDLNKYPNLVTGAIFTTSIEGLLVNIIAYEVNPSIINEFYYKRYSTENIEKQETRFFEQLLEIMKKNNVKLSENLKLTLVEKGISKKLVFYDAQKNNPDFPFISYRDFYRNGLSNPFSSFYLDEASIHPSLNKILSLIKKAGGKAFLAHPYEYGIKVEGLIDKLVDEGIDGLEVFHPSAALRQSLKLLNICKKENLLASGGSDYRKARYHIPIGVNIHSKLYEDDSFLWLNKYKKWSLKWVITFFNTSSFLQLSFQHL